MKYRAAGTTCVMAESENFAMTRMQISHKWTLLRMCHSWHSPFKFIEHKRKSQLGAKK